MDAKVPEGVPNNHQLTEGQFVYYEQLAKAGDFDTLPDFYREGLEVWRDNQEADWPRFKDNDMVRVDGRFVIKHR